MVVVGIAVGIGVVVGVVVGFGFPVGFVVGVGGAFVVGVGIVAVVGVVVIQNVVNDPCLGGFCGLGLVAPDAFQTLKLPMPASWT